MVAVRGSRGAARQGGGRWWLGGPSGGGITMRVIREGQARGVGAGGYWCDKATGAAAHKWQKSGVGQDEDDTGEVAHSLNAQPVAR